ncbi:MAG: hypothetical protein Q9221_001097 [Calogaya cf. arnoldii]
MGIELLQNGSIKQIEEHTSGSDLVCGKYSRWNILKDFIIVNFCFGSNHRDLRKTELVNDTALFSKIYQVVFDDEEGLLTVYSADHELVARLRLQESSHDDSSSGDYPAGDTK